MPVTFEFNRETGILTKVGRGKLNLTEMILAWDKAFKDYFYPPKKIRGIILDYRDADFNFEVGSQQSVVDFYKKNKEILSHYKIAVITTNPKNSTLPLLVTAKLNGFQYQLFSTMEAATGWVMDSENILRN